MIALVKQHLHRAQHKDESTSREEKNRHILYGQGGYGSEITTLFSNICSSQSKLQVGIPVFWTLQDHQKNQ